MTTNFRFPYSTPESQGIPSPAILDFVNAVEAQKLDLHSFMLLRHGHVVAEGWWGPYERECPHTLFSLSKSFASTAVGLAVDEGLLTIDDPVISFFPDDLPISVSPNLAAMQVSHLLSMVTGHGTDTTEHLHKDKEGNWVRTFLAQPVENRPGAPFVYNSGATYMLSAIVQKLTGKTVLDYLQPRLFEPLGIKNPTWESCPRGINFGGWGLNIATEDIARFGQLYLQKGLWHGQRLVPEAWIEAASSKQVSNGDEPDNDWNQGYGYQFWRCRHNIYRGDGAFGQYCIVMPDQDAVLAITSGTSNMQAVLNAVWGHLLPDMSTEVLSEDGHSNERLKTKLGNLQLSLPMEDASSPKAQHISGQQFLVEKNEGGVLSISLTLETDGWVYDIEDGQGSHSIAGGYDRWQHGATTYGPGGEHPIAAAGVWTEADTFVMAQWYTATPFCRTVSCQFGTDTVTVKANLNVNFGPVELPQLEGRLA